MGVCMVAWEHAPYWRIGRGVGKENTRRACTQITQLADVLQVLHYMHVYLIILSNLEQLLAFGEIFLQL